jgi:hypothetical protein
LEKRGVGRRMTLNALQKLIETNNKRKSEKIRKNE